MRSQEFARVVAMVGASFLGGAGCVAHAQGTASAGAEAPVVFTSEPTLVELTRRSSSSPRTSRSDSTSERWVVRSLRVSR